MNLFKNNRIDSGYQKLVENPALEEHLGYRSFCALARKPGRLLVVDYATGRRELTSGKLLGAAMVLADRWKERISHKRVGVVFPAGLGSILVNLSLVLADKIPVNLNFTAGRAASESSIQKADMGTIISAKPVMEKFPDFPWPADTIDLAEERKTISKLSVLKWLVLFYIVPAKFLVRFSGIPEKGGNTEAALLFSSGSTGEPKGVPLTHRNIIANCLQIEAVELLDSNEVLLGNLPTFHSFGFTVTLWYPLLVGMKVVTLPSPLETKNNAKAIAAEKVTVMMGTPTFYRPYFQRAEAAQLNSLKYVVAGAEKTPPGFPERWETQFGSRFLEGYGLTEASPVVSANLPDTAASHLGETLQRDGSVGKMLPGMQAFIANPDTLEPQDPTVRGMLLLRGPNIFNGYMDDPEATAETFVKDWFITGDLGRFDDDGFLYIEGRLRRFSKIGGEMVPHGNVEQSILKAFDMEESEFPTLAVTGIPSKEKGEVLVLLTTFEIDPIDLRKRLLRQGIPNLWIPRILHRVEQVPYLPSGKLDLQGISQVAREATASPAFSTTEGGRSPC